MNVLIDYCGHSDLWYNFHLLFEKRLGWNIYFPEGKDWLDRGYVSQFGNICDTDEEKAITSENGIHCHPIKMEPDKGHLVAKGIEYSTFLKMEWDVILCSVYFNEQSFHKLVKEQASRAVFIRQIANIHETSLGWCKNILSGAAYHPSDHENFKPPSLPTFKYKDINYCVYFPEQYEGYSYTEPTNHKSVVCLSRGLSKDDWKAWDHFRASLEPQGFTFQMYGDQSREYELDPILKSNSVPHRFLPQKMKEIGFLWYTKPAGGGGYTVREALASGRPVIIRKSYSDAGSMIETKLFKHAVNCIDLDKITHKGRYDLGLIKSWSEPAEHIKICKQVFAHYEQDTKFAVDAEHVKNWILQLPKGV